MAAEDPVKQLCEEATCPLCLDYFKDPVTLDCGHNFCQVCFNQHWREATTGSACPQCRDTVQPRNFQPNRQLANLVELVKTLRGVKGGAAAAATAGAGRWGMCKAHLEPLKLFCENDQVPICVVCDRSKEHRHHSAFPIEEASQVYKEKITVYLESLKDKKKKFVEQMLDEELRRQKCVKELEMEKGKIQSAFEKIQEFLQEKLNIQLGQLEDLKKEMDKWQGENVAKLSKEISRLDELIAEMEVKSLQPASEFLQDIRSALSRNERNSACELVDLSSKMEEALRIASEKSSALEKVLENYQVYLEQALSKECLEQVLRADYLKQAVNKVNVTLDPDTAHPLLILSRDLKGVRRVWSEQVLPHNPERFDEMPFVLGRERFISGRHWWEVDVCRESAWAVGVAAESVRRKGLIDINPNEGIWAVGKLNYSLHSLNPCLAFTSPQLTHLILRSELRKIQVALDFEAGCVEFYDADTGEFIFTFQIGTFSGERIRPFLQVCCDVSLKF